VKLLAERIAPMSGQVTRAQRLGVGYFAQHQLDELDPNEGAYAHLRRLMPDAPEAKVRARAGAIGFAGASADTPAGQLSGGEKARLLIGLATFAGPHLVILDEPTNHLDIDSRAALIEAINAYPGAVMLVSHDRHLIEACADRLWLVADGQVVPFEGDLDDYRRHVLAERGAPAKDNGGRKDEASPRPARADARRAAAERRVELAPLRRRITAAEAVVTRLNEEIGRIDAALAEPGLFARDSAKAAALAKARADHVAALSKAEEDWLEASTALEAAGQ
jgi:ATP-binding cassette subfamily F protein 3